MPTYSQTARIGSQAGHVRFSQGGEHLLFRDSSLFHSQDGMFVKCNGILAAYVGVSLDFFDDGHAQRPELR